MTDDTQHLDARLEPFGIYARVEALEAKVSKDEADKLAALDMLAENYKLLDARLKAIEGRISAGIAKADAFLDGMTGDE